MWDKMNQHLLLSLTNARPNAAGFLPMTASGGHEALRGGPVRP
jgi:hypothetical protein